MSKIRKENRAMKKSPWLTLNDRVAIEKMYNDGQRVDAIAQSFGRNITTIYHELKKGFTGEMDKNGRPGYSADIAQKESYRYKMQRRQQA